MNEYRNISNPDNIPIAKTEIYNDIWEYRIPEDYYFESFGISYGNRIYGTTNLTNYYVIKKRENEIDLNKKME